MNNPPKGTKLEKIKSILLPGKKYSVQNKALCFTGDRVLPENTAGESLLGRVQDILKRHGRLYYLLISIFAPVYPGKKMRDSLDELLSEHGQDKVIFNLGSGPQVIKGRMDIINIDIFAFDNVDIVADAGDLPIESNKVDLVLNMAMLEHVSKPEQVVEEMLRILKPGGKTLSYVPFMVPYHAAPHDFHRWSESGLKNLFKDYDIVEIGVGSGPTSGMLYVLLEWMSMVLSFGNRKVHDLIFLALMVVSAPVKLLDILLIKHPNARKIASGFYVLARKKNDM